MCAFSRFCSLNATTTVICASQNTLPSGARGMLSFSTFSQQQQEASESITVKFSTNWLALSAKKKKRKEQWVNFQLTSSSIRLLWMRANSKKLFISFENKFLHENFLLWAPNRKVSQIAVIRWKEAKRGGGMEWNIWGNKLDKFRLFISFAVELARRLQHQRVSMTFQWELTVEDDQS